MSAESSWNRHRIGFLLKAGKCCCTAEFGYLTSLSLTDPVWEDTTFVLGVLYFLCNPHHMRPRYLSNSVIVNIYYQSACESNRVGTASALKTSPVLLS